MSSEKSVVEHVVGGEVRCTFYRDTQQSASDAFVEDRNTQLATWCRRSHINVRLVLRQLQRVPVVEEKSIRIRIKKESAYSTE